MNSDDENILDFTPDDTPLVTAEYNEDAIKTLDWNVHIQRRPGMYIGKLGDGSSPDDGIYVLLKEVIDNSLDEFMMGYGKYINVTVQPEGVTVRDQEIGRAHV